MSSLGLEPASVAVKVSNEVPTMPGSDWMPPANAASARTMRQPSIEPLPPSRMTKTVNDVVVGVGVGLGLVATVGEGTTVLLL